MAMDLLFSDQAVRSVNCEKAVKGMARVAAVSK
jgi:hypothetical protein